MKISVSIMAHPDRADQVRTLQNALGIPVPVGWDDEGKPSRDPNRVWRTARRAWGLYCPSADWHLLLQDDAVIADHLLEALPSALERVPMDAVVSLYAGSGRPLAGMWAGLERQAAEMGACWIVGPRPLWGVALMLPTPLVGSMMRWCDRQSGIPDDMRVGRWARSHALQTWYTWPSLVDHPDGGSLVGHGAGRTARRYASGDARALDWGAPVLHWGGTR